MVANIHIADLFCGAGGTSTGAVEAIEMLGHRAHLTAINHWDIAIATHSVNHPGSRHLCASLDNINPRDLYKEGELDALWASPECTHHSIARGGKPINDQSRATAWCVTRWAEALRPPVILVENVPEFLTWGPIGANGRPLASRKGEVFRAWCAALESLGYRVGHRVLCAADYGDPTTRERLFVQAVRGRRKIIWPDPTHAQGGDTDLFGARRPWVPARDIIDWSIPGQSVFERKRPLSPKTMRRIWSGLERFGLTAFSISAGGPECTARPINKPLGTVLTRAHRAIVNPYIITMEHGGGVRSADRPLSTVTCAKGGAMGVAKPFLVKFRGESNGEDIDMPLTTVTTTGNHHALAEPFLVEYYGNGGAHPVTDPLNTVTCKDRHALVRPTVVIDGERYLLDIRFRMLQPHELAAAQGFRRDYKFTGTKTQQVKQIGNAVPRNLARALVLAAIGQRSDIGGFFND